MTRLQFKGKILQTEGSSLIFSPILQTFDDWFLPSRDELEQMYLNLHAEGVGNFSTKGGYWSSSESSSSESYTLAMATYSITTSSKDATFKVRSCRTFTADAGAYSLRYVGPAGGLIFYIDVTTYYEAAPSDQITLQVWSNVDNISAKTNLTIGTGQSYTTAIINQPGHTTSAAKLCNDLIL